MSEHRERLPSPPMRPPPPVCYSPVYYRRGLAPLAGLAVVIAVIAYAESATTTAIALVALTVLLAALVVFLRRR